MDETNNDTNNEIAEQMIIPVEPTSTDPEPNVEPSDEKSNLEGSKDESEPTSEESSSTSQALQVLETKPDFILPFKAIHSFVISLNEEFGTKNKPLRLYARLIEQTTFSHEKPIQKHVQAFTQFCTTNRDAILAKKWEGFVQNKVSYSDRVFIPFKDLFKMADSDQRSVMWQHVLTISALVDPSAKAKQILKQSAGKGAAKEANFLANIIEKVEQNVKIDGSANPMEAIGQIMNSGILTDLIGSMNQNTGSGQLDMGKMFGMVQNMIGMLTKEQPEMGAMISGLMQNMGSMMPTASTEPNSSSEPTKPE